MTMRLQLTVESKSGRSPLDFQLRRMYNFGGTMRDPKVFYEHLEEMKKQGIQVKMPKELPVIMQIPDWAVTTSAEITVRGSKTSGEVEPVLLWTGSRWYLGVGSDHSDRDLERTDIIFSKTVCPNVVAPAVWPLEEVEEHWDQVLIESDVVRDGRTKPYQRTTLATFLTPKDFLKRIEKRVPPWGKMPVLLSCGTPPTVDKELDYSTTFTIRMVDPLLKRRIEHTYNVIVLDKEPVVN